MTSPEDDGLEEALRRALSEAAGEVEPGGDGLDKIHARIGSRPPRPWLLSVILGVVERVRYWTWRGHWAWPTSLPKIPGLRGTRSRRSNFPRMGIRVAPTRGSTRRDRGHRQRHAWHSAIQARDPPGERRAEWRWRTTAGQRENRGQRSADHRRRERHACDGWRSVGRGQAGAGPTPSAAARSRTVKPHPAATAKCAPTTSPVAKGAQSSLTDVTPPQVSATTPSTQVTGPLVPSPAASPQPDSTSTATCPVASPTASPTPTPTGSPSSPVPTPWATSPTPTYTDPSPWPTTPTADPSPPGYHRPSPSGPPSCSRPDRQRGMPADHAPRRR